MLPDSLKKFPELVWARRLVWAFFWLLIFEGALRKWILPELSNWLLLVRDPVLIAIYALVASRSRWPRNGFLFLSFWLAILLGASAILWGHGNWAVMAYGLRTDFLYIPLIFIIPELFSLNDIREFGRKLMWISIPMAGLIILQFLLPANHILNAAAGGTPGQLPGAMGHVRPAGTFPFITGTIAFLAIQLAFIADAFINRQNKLLRNLSLIAFIFALACTVSRTALFSCLIVVAAIAWGFFINPKHAKRSMIFFGFGVLFVVLAGMTPIFQQAWQTFDVRFVEAGEGRTPLGGVGDRLFNDFTEPLKLLKTVSMTGAGTGAGTNVGAVLLTGKPGFLLAEVEWSRLLMESGLILGLFLIGLRVALTGYLVYWGYRSLKKSENALPWMLAFAIMPLVFNGMWGQPTILGFATFFAGFVLAATRATYESHPIFKYAYSATRL